MLEKQVFNKIMQQMKEITMIEMSLWTIDGTCVNSTHEIHAKAKKEILHYISSESHGAEISISETRDVIIKDQSIKIEPLQIDDSVQMYLMFHALDVDPRIKKLCISQMVNMFEVLSGNNNKQVFLGDVILGRVKEECLYLQAKKFGIKVNTQRVIFLLECPNDTESSVVHMVESLYATGIKDYVLEISSGLVVFIKELELTHNNKDIYTVARVLEDTISAELMLQIRIAFSDVLHEFKEVTQGYQQAFMSLEVGSSFYTDRKILDYTKLGIGRLIYQLPKELSETFLKEVLDGEALSRFDEETMTAVYKFFQNNLNISETARQLYLHRNTLVYRLEKIHKKTGLDVRVFEDAMTFKTALMVAEHIRFMEKS